jgi:hypothetical protein
MRESRQQRHAAGCPGLHLARSLRSSGGGVEKQLGKSEKKPKRLPILMRALDFEQRTLAVQTVLCPVRLRQNTVGNCRQRRDSRRVNCTTRQGSLICAGTRDSERQAESTPTVQQRVQLPGLCASVETEVASVLPYVHAFTRCIRGKAFLFLDTRAKPVGIVMSSEHSCLRGAQLNTRLPLVCVMNTSFATAVACTSLANDRSAQSWSSFPRYVSCFGEWRAIGLVWESD